MEYVMIAGFVALVIIPTTFIFYRYASDSSDEIDRAQVDKFGRDVVSTAETVYYLGPPSRIVLEERLPKNVQGISVYRDPATGTYTLSIATMSSGVMYNATFPTKVKIASLVDNESITPGLKSVRIEAEISDDGTSFAGITFREPLRIFATSQLYKGDLGGLAGADSKCQALANAAGLAGTWNAWLSTSTVNAKDRITNQKYVRMDHARVAFGIEDLTDNLIANPIGLDENGVQPPENIPVWTGTTGSGVASSDARCNDWTNSDVSVLGRFGITTSKTATWTHFATFNCNTILRLYCFEQ